MTELRPRSAASPCSPHVDPGIGQPVSDAPTRYLCLRGWEEWAELAVTAGRNRKQAARRCHRHQRIHMVNGSRHPGPTPDGAAVRLHASSVCEIQNGWRLAFPPFEAITVHYVLRGSGALRVGNGPWLPFASRSALVVPARRPHVIGEAAPLAQIVRADEHCSLLADGLVKFTAGDGRRDTLLLCGAISTSHGSALGLFDLLREPMIEDFPPRLSSATPST